MIDPDTITNKAGQPGDDYDANADKRKKRSEARLEAMAIRKGWIVSDAEREEVKAKVLESLRVADPIEQPRSIATLANTVLSMEKSDLEHDESSDKRSRLDNDEPTENVVCRMRFAGQPRDEVADGND